MRLVRLLGIIGTILFAISYPAYSQNVCDIQINDSAGVLKNPAGIRQSITKLSAQGADVRVVTVLNDGGNLDKLEATMEHDCPSWQAGDGSRKSTLAVFMLSVATHHSGIYTGIAFHKAIENDLTRIRTSFMNPSFKAKDYDAGFMLAINQVASRIQAGSVESKGPVTIKNEAPAVDYSRVMLFFFLAMMFLAVGILWYAIRRGIRLRREAKESATADLSMAKTSTALILNRLRSAVSEAAIIKVNKAGVQRIQDEFYTLSEDFTSLSNSEGSDGDLEKEYIKLRNQLSNLEIRLRGIDTPVETVPPASSAFHARERAKEYDSPVPFVNKPSTSASVHNHTTVVNNYNDNGYVAPIFVPIVEEPVYERPVYREREPEPEPSYSYSDSSRDDSSSSDYSSSSSSSDDSSSDYSSSDSSSDSSSGGF